MIAYFEVLLPGNVIISFNRKIKEMTVVLRLYERNLHNITQYFIT